MSTHVKNNVYWDPHNKVHEWSPSQVAEDVVRLLLVGQEVSTLSHGPPWTPPRPNSSISAEEIAESLDDYFCSIFREVSRKDWIQAALGYDTASVAILLEEGLNTRLVLYQWFKQTTLPTNTHELVEGILRSRNPLAYWTVSKNMWPFGMAHPSEALYSLLHHFSPLTVRQEGDLMCWVRQLAVLAERFQQNICAMDVDWNKNLLSGSTLLRQISCEDLGMLADGIKEEDLTNFRDLRRDDFSQVESTYLRGLGVRWQTLSEIARACAVVDSDVAERIGKVVKRLLSLHDYQSMIALLTGLHHANVCPPNVSDLFAPIDSDNNYANYRAHWAKKPGIPFLFPHVKELRQTGDTGTKLDELFRSWSHQREEPEISNQDMVYSCVDFEAPRMLAWGVWEYFNCFRCS